MKNLKAGCKMKIGRRDRDTLCFEGGIRKRRDNNLTQIASHTTQPETLSISSSNRRV